MNVVSWPGRTVAYLRDVRAEVRKVTWPTLEDLRKSTVAIVLFVVALGLLIGLIDWLWALILVSWLGRAFG
jgi:preprotein translocase subunit SecE